MIHYIFRQVYYNCLHLFFKFREDIFSLFISSFPLLLTKIHPLDILFTNNTSGGFKMNQKMNEQMDEVSNKLIILYILNKLEMPVSQMQLMKIILENRYMNYFTFQEIVKGLLETSFISSTQNEYSEIYTITDLGIKSLNFFEERIPRGIRKYLDNNTTQLKSSVLTDSFILANIIEENNEFVVNCKISENEFSLINIHLTVGTRADAQLICNNWKKSSGQIYAEIIDSLNKRR